MRYIHGRVEVTDEESLTRLSTQIGYDCFLAADAAVVLDADDDDRLNCTR